MSKKCLKIIFIIPVNQESRNENNFDLTLYRLANIHKITDNKCRKGHGEKQNPYSLLVGLQFSAATKEIKMENSQKPKNILP